jgi:hypothetical protein
MNKTSSEWRPAETVKPNPTQAAPLGLHLPTQILLASHHLLFLTTGTATAQLARLLVLSQ